MTKQKSAKRALLYSALSLVVCVSMLIGSTFAWFTDNVSAAGNIIKSGILDVDLVDDAGNSLDGKVLKFVDQDENFLWEPGCTYNLQNVYVENKGNLALKYELTIHGISGDAKLLEVIDWTVSVGGVATAVENLNGYLLPETKTDAILLSGHMKEEAGNEYQDLSIDGISITLIATQYASEADSFGIDYDANAAYPILGVANVADGAAATTIAADNVSVTVPEGSEAGVYAVAVTDKKETTDENGQTTFSADINLLKDGVKVQKNDTTVYLVKINIGAEKVIVDVLHNGNTVADYNYDATTGILSFETDSFSPFKVVFEENKVIKVNSSEEFLNALNTAAVGAVIDANGLTIDINELGADLPTGKRAVSFPAGVTIKNLTAVGTYRGGNTLYFQGPADQEIVFENCVFELSGRSMALDFLGAADGANSIVYNNCQFKGAIVVEFINYNSGVATYNNCTFTKHPGSGNSYVMASGGTHLFNECTFDYTGLTQSNMGVINTCSVNSVSESDGSNSTVVVLNGCTRVNCGTRQYGSDSKLTIK